VREFRLEGPGLLLGGGMLVAALAGAFFLGRWVERRAVQPPPADAGTDPLARVVTGEPPFEVEPGMDYFDGARGAPQEFEPSREVGRPVEPAAETTPAVAPEPMPATGPAPSDGPFFVQVFAGRDRRTVERLVAELRRGGYPVMLDSEAEGGGGGALFRIRVGGYPGEADALHAARNLKAEGFRDAFVTRRD
jgi:cell division septation protein DedD